MTWAGPIAELGGGRAAKKITTGVMRRWRLAFANLKARSFIPSWICHGHICRALSIGVSFFVDLPFHIISWIYLGIPQLSRFFTVLHGFSLFVDVFHGLSWLIIIFPQKLPMVPTSQG
jgi:uncharacterized membrane-anchored protein YitT (DUF2179 family)